MNRFWTFIVGPELYWVLIYAFIVFLIKTTNAPVKYMDDWWERLGFIVPLILIPLSFSLYWLPFIPKKLLLLRLIVSCMIGSHYVLDRGLHAHTEQNPGTGTIYLMGILFGLIVLAGMSIFLLFKKIIVFNYQSSVKCLELFFNTLLCAIMRVVYSTWKKT